MSSSTSQSANAGLTTLGAGAVNGEGIGEAASREAPLSPMIPHYELNPDGSAGAAEGGCSSENEWTVLLSRLDHPLTATGEVFLHDNKNDASDWLAYDRFRI